MLDIFPKDSLASSVTTSVWIGVMVFAFFNLRFGWALSGLVVPGYLVPLIILKPWVVLIIIVEAVLTYVAARFVSSFPARIGLWSNFFGRDRFFLILLMSIIVRITCDGWLLPLLGEYLNQTLHLNFDYKNNLHSFGLIIIALTANLLWKPGLIRGVATLSVTVFVTYLIVRYGLIEYTNFSISNLNYLYENISSSMLASPKSYMIITIAAFIASRMNLLYGWEYNGILIPALFALLWYQPLKIITSIVEASIIFFACEYILQLSLFKKFTCEGARKVVLFFNVSFFYKITLAYFLITYFPDIKVTDYYGFGYLLPTLIALKMHEKNTFFKIVRPAVQVSFYAILLASIIGITLTLIPDPFAESLAVSDVKKMAPVNKQGTLDLMLNQDNIKLYAKRKMNSVQIPLLKEISLFRAGLRKIKKYLEGRDPQYLDEAAGILSALRYTVTIVEDKYIYLAERSPKKGGGIYAINIKSKNNMLIEVPAPLDEWGTFDSGVRLFKEFKALGLAIAGSSRLSNKNQSADVLVNFENFFNVFHKEFSQMNTVQVRGGRSPFIEKTPTTKNHGREKVLPPKKTSVWVTSSIPKGLNLEWLKDSIEEINIEWGSPSSLNIQRETSPSGFAEIYFTPLDMVNLLYPPAKTSQNSHKVQRVSGYIQSWLAQEKSLIAGKDSNAYTPPGLAELIFFDEEILTPLSALITNEYKEKEWTKKGKSTLPAISAAAAKIGYILMLYKDKGTRQEYLVLKEKSDIPKELYWGTYVFRLGKSNPYFVEIVRPGFEMQVFEYGISLFDRIEAEILLISGTHPYANRNFSSDLNTTDNIRSIYSLVNQVFLREKKNSEPAMVIQCRGYDANTEEGNAQKADGLVAIRKTMPSKELETLKTTLLNTLEQDGLTIKMVEGKRETSGYENGNSPQFLYMEATTNKEFAILWLSTLIRNLYHQNHEKSEPFYDFSTLGIETIEADIVSYVSGVSFAPIKQSRFQTIKKFTETYIRFNDIVALDGMNTLNHGYTLTHLIDINSKNSFIVIKNQKKQIVLVTNLAPKKSGSIFHVSKRSLSKTEIGRYISSHTAYLFFRG